MEKNVAPVNLIRISSWVGVTWCSPWVAALRSLESRQSLNLPVCFRQQTRLLTQGVGSPSSSFLMMTLMTTSSNSFFDVLEGDWHASWTMNQCWNIEVDCNVILSGIKHPVPLKQSDPSTCSGVLSCRQPSRDEVILNKSAKLTSRDRATDQNLV